MSNLKPCPFCGSDKVEYRREHISGEQQVECNVCGKAVLFDVDLTDEFAIAAWNQRASRWIPVGEELPRQAEDVWVITDKGYYYAAYWAPVSGTPVWYKVGGIVINKKVTHWQPLPEPPTSR